MKSDPISSGADSSRGDERATVASIYRQHHTWLFGLLRSRLGAQQADAWDLVQDTFERVLKHPKWDDLSRPRGYLSAIAKRLLIDRHRRKAIEDAYLEALAQQPEALAPSAQAIAEAIEQLSRVCMALDRMPDRMRLIFVRARIDALAYDVIARQLKVSVNVVQKDMIQAWQRIYHAIYG